jgi:hypothetical protein
MAILHNYFEVTGGKCMAKTEPCMVEHCRHHLYSDMKPEQIELSTKPKVRCTLKLGNCGGMTLSEVGAMMGLTRERIRQIECRALIHLARKPMAKHLYEHIESVTVKKE